MDGTKEPYDNLSDLELLELAIWREARGESYDGKRGVAHVVRNRVYGTTKWWGNGSYRSVILHPYQFSSFLPDDPNADRWPGSGDVAWADCVAIALAVSNGTDEDLTLGATMYYDTSIPWPHEWGNPGLYDNTLNVGKLRFFKLKPVASSVDEADA